VRGNLMLATYDGVNGEDSCVAKPRRADNASLKPNGKWLGISNCCSD
jgi:hypothetical protein